MLSILSIDTPILEKSNLSTDSVRCPFKYLDWMVLFRAHHNILTNNRFSVSSFHAGKSWDHNVNETPRENPPFFLETARQLHS